MSSRRNDGPGNNVAKVVTFESTQQQLAVYQKSEPNEGKTGDAVKDLEAKLNYITETVPIRAENVSGSQAGAGSGEFHTYRAARRREQMRLDAMDREDAANKARDAFEARRAEIEAKEEAETAKKRNKRHAKKERQRAAKKARKEGAGDESAGAGAAAPEPTDARHDDDKGSGGDFEELD